VQTSAIEILKLQRVFNHPWNDQVFMTSTFTLFCYVRGEESRRVFEVDIGKQKSVAALKKAIKEEKSQAFRDIDADSLVLWNVSVPFNRSLKGNVEQLSLVDDESLQPPDILVDVFPSGLEKRSVHIVVKRPPPGEFWMPVPRS
jgi:hypothetical protein